MRIVLFILFCASTHLIVAQTLEFDWVKPIGGISGKNAITMELDIDGNVIVAGIFNGTMDIDPGPAVMNFTTVSTDNDFFIAKFDADGLLIWAKEFKGANENIIADIAISTDDFIYATGSFSGTCDFDPTSGTVNLVSTGSNDAFVLKLDNTNGALVWAKQMGGVDDEGGESLSIDHVGNIVTHGFYNGTSGADFDPSAVTFLLSDGNFYHLFVSKLDANGNFVMANMVNGNGIIKPCDLETDSDGNIYSIGYFYGIADMDPGAAVATFSTIDYETDMFLMKLDASGNSVWVKQLSLNCETEAINLTIGHNDVLYLSSLFHDTADFDPNTGVVELSAPVFATHGFLAKYSSDGNLIQVRQMGEGNNWNWISDLHLTSNNEIYITGAFTSDYNFDPGISNFTLTCDSSSSTFIAAYDSSLNFTWAKQFYSSHESSGIAIRMDTDESLYTFGQYKDTVDFDPGINEELIINDGNWDLYLHKMSLQFLKMDFPSKNATTTIYPNPVQQSLTILLEQSSEVYMYDISGRMVLNTILLKGINHLDVSTLNEGIYILKIDSSGEGELQKIVVSR